MTAGNMAAEQSAIANKNDLVVDLRSDTVTKPTREMFAFAARAEVDDDVLGHDPSCLELENHVASLFGKEAGLFVPSGTMSNLCALMTHCPERGSEFIVGDKGGAATIAGIHPRVVRNQQDGTLDIDEVLDAIRPSDDHFPVTRLVCIENTHNKCGGRVLPKEFIDRLGEAAHARGLLVHMDGARVMNACAALGTSPHELCAACDSVSVCLSKALGSPVGSVLVGPKDFIIRARRNRKALGGGMRQAGVIAAMGLYGIRTFSGESLVRDHRRLKKLASALATISGFKVDLDAVQSNILYFDTGEMAQVIVDLLKRSGILVIATGMHTIRACVHHQVSDEMINRAIDVFREIPDALFAMDSVEGQQHR